MKQLFILLSLALISLTNFAQDNQTNKFVLKSGYVEYELTGSITGTKKFWWDKYGDKTRTETKSTSVIKMFGTTTKEEQHTISITSGNTIYSQDLIKGTAYKSSNDEYEEMAQEMTEDMTDAEIEQMGEEFLASLGGERLGTEKVLGKNCEVIKVMMAKVWMYKGIPLKSEAKVMRIETNETAVKFDENISIPSSTFIPDKGVEFQEISGF
jgi:hypothetical protein